MTRLKNSVPVTLLATARSMERSREHSHELINRLRTAIEHDHADVMGGPYVEDKEPLLHPESILWLYHKGAEAYRRCLDDRTVETLARRRFGFTPMLAQVARRFGMRTAYPVSFDGGTFPLPRESKRLWEAPDGTTIESLTTPPISADLSSGFLEIPRRLLRAYRDDHPVVVPVLHWPSPVAGWYEDVIRTCAYSPVFARASTVGEFFKLSDRPWETLRGKPDDYASPYLAQSLSQSELRPISELTIRWRNRARFEQLRWVDAMERMWQL